MMNLQLANGDELCRVIEQVSELEWRRFQAREVKVMLKTGEVYQEDHSKFPPFTSIRFKNENLEFIAKLRFAIETYKGDLEWHMFGHQRLTLPGINWIIRPLFIEKLISQMGDECSQDLSSYVAEYYPDFASIAYADLLGLAEHVRKVFVG
jgi:hypothetical protein